MPSTPTRRGDTNGDHGSADAGDFLNEFAVGKNGELFPEGTGRLLKAGSKIKWDFHYHSVGQETPIIELGIVLYPKGTCRSTAPTRSSSASRPSRSTSGRVDLRQKRRLHALQ